MRARLLGGGTLADRGVAFLFEVMNRINFPEQLKTSVFINGNNSITIQQNTGFLDDETDIVVISSKKMALELAKAIRAFAQSASFQIPEEE